jgi:hypothetical protein
MALKARNSYDLFSKKAEALKQLMLKARLCQKMQVWGSLAQNTECTM